MNQDRTRYLLNAGFGLIVYVLFMLKHGIHSTLTPEIYYYAEIAEGANYEPWYEWTHYFLKLLGMIPHDGIPIIISTITIFLIAFWAIALFKICKFYFDEATGKIVYICTFIFPFFNTWRMGFFTHDVIQITIWFGLWLLLISKNMNETIKKTILYSGIVCGIAIINIPLNYSILPGAFLLLVFAWYSHIIKQSLKLKICSIIGIIFISCILVIYSHAFFVSGRISDTIPYYHFPKDLLLQIGVCILSIPFGIYIVWKENKVPFLLGFIYYAIITIFSISAIIRYWTFFFVILGAIGFKYIMDTPRWRGLVLIIAFCTLLWQGMLFSTYTSGEYVAFNGVHEIEWIAMNHMKELPEGTIWTLWDHKHVMSYLSGHEVKEMNGEIWWKNQEVAYDLARKNNIKYIYLTNYEFRVVGDPILFPECGVKIYPVQTKFIEPNAPCLTLSEDLFPSRFIYFAMFEQERLWGFKSVNWIWQEDIYGYNTGMRIWVIEVLTGE